MDGQVWLNSIKNTGRHKTEYFCQWQDAASKEMDKIRKVLPNGTYTSL